MNWSKLLTFLYEVMKIIIFAQFKAFLFVLSSFVRPPSLHCHPMSAFGRPSLPPSSANVRIYQTPSPFGCWHNLWPAPKTFHAPEQIACGIHTLWDTRFHNSAWVAWATQVQLWLLIISDGDHDGKTPFCKLTLAELENTGNLYRDIRVADLNVIQYWADFSLVTDVYTCKKLKCEETKFILWLWNFCWYCPYCDYCHYFNLNVNCQLL